LRTAFAFVFQGEGMQTSTKKSIDVSLDRNAHPHISPETCNRARLIASSVRWRSHHA